MSNFDFTDAEHTVCFTGHRMIPPAEKKQLAAALDAGIRRLVSEGFFRFLCGGALGFDMLAEEAVLRAREKDPRLRLALVLPCAGQSSRWPEAEKNRYNRLLHAADHVLVLSPHYYPGCMLTRNRYMVDHSSRCVCYLHSFRGGTMSTVKYALQKQMRIDNLAMDLLPRRDQGLLKEDETWNSIFISLSARKNAVTVSSRRFRAKAGKWNRMWTR